jgi:hypothetical protein
MKLRDDRARVPSAKRYRHVRTGSEESTSLGVHFYRKNNNSPDTFRTDHELSVSTTFYLLAATCFDLYEKCLSHINGAGLFTGPYLHGAPIPAAARSKVWACGCSLAGIAGSIPAESMDVCLL